MKNPHVVKNLANPTYLMAFFGAAVLFFDFQYYLMSTLPGSRDNMCVDGINLTPVNIVFSILLSLLFGMMLANLVALFGKQVTKKKKASLTSVTGVGLWIGAMTLFCPACSLPVISVFGLSLGFEFVNDFNLWIKLASMALMVYSLVMVNRQLSGACKSCVYEIQDV